MELTLTDYRKKVSGCWMGKNIGGTLGAPFEWKRQKNNVNFYIQDLNGDPLPNDDLDIQLLWLIAMEEKGINVNSRLLGEYWLSYVTPHWSEYGTAKANMRAGLIPPCSGTENNVYRDSCGAFIRSEIWACIAPGCPEISAKYAYEDGIIDHGNGEGTYAEVFCAALQSAAFVENDIIKLIEAGISYIPDDCGTANAIRTACQCYESGLSREDSRDRILEMHRGSYADWAVISDEDRAKGFAEGKLGYDAPSNIALVVFSLLYGEGDFEKSICTAVNCGEDTDCTAATVAATLGILHGIDYIPAKWKEPIGEKIKTACLNLGELGFYGDQLPSDINNLTERVEKLAMQVLLRHNIPYLTLGQTGSKTFGVKLNASESFKKIYADLDGPVFSFDFFDVVVNYIDGVYLKFGESKKFRITIINKYKFQESVNLYWYTNPGIKILPSRSGKIYISQRGLPESKKEIEFEILIDGSDDSKFRFILEITIDGRSTTMLVPVVFLKMF